MSRLASIVSLSLDGVVDMANGAEGCWTASGLCPKVNDRILAA